LYFNTFMSFEDQEGWGTDQAPNCFFLRYDIFGFDQPGFPLLHTSVGLVHFGRFVVALIDGRGEGKGVV
jgi:hypothetical protein